MQAGRNRSTNVVPLRQLRAGGATTYDGVPYRRLPIDAVDWRHRGELLRRRSVLAGRAGELDVEPEWATEAALDRGRLVGDGGGASGLGVRVVGRSVSSGLLLTVVLVPKRRPPTGEWWGATAWVADEAQRRAYRDASAGGWPR